MFEKQYRDKIATIKKQQGTEEKAMAKARSAAAKHRADAAKELAQITPRTSESPARIGAAPTGPSATPPGKTPKSPRLPLGDGHYGCGGGRCVEPAVACAAGEVRTMTTAKQLKARARGWRGLASGTSSLVLV